VVSADLITMDEVWGVWRWNALRTQSNMDAPFFEISSAGTQAGQPEGTNPGPHHSFR